MGRGLLMTFDPSELAVIVIALMLFMIVVAWYFGLIGDEKKGDD